MKQPENNHNKSELESNDEQKELPLSSRIKLKLVKMYNDGRTILQGNWQEEKRKRLSLNQKQRLKRIENGQPIKRDISYFVSVTDNARKKIYSTVTDRYKKAKALEAAVNEVGTHQAETKRVETHDGFIIDERKV